MTERPRILVVDDDREIAALVGEMLERNGYAWRAAYDGAGLRAAIASDPRIALVILDLGLPDEDGLDLCRAIRTTTAVPIIMLTARGDPIDRVIGLEIGADDYLAKPFEPRELLARIRSVLRRTTATASPPTSTRPGAEPERLRFGQWTLDLRRRHLVAGDGEVTPLSGGEFRLLTALIERRGEVLAREILHQLSGGDPDGALDRSVDLRISRLRAKLGEDLAGSPMIKTVRGRGYVFSEVVTPC